MRYIIIWLVQLCNVFPHYLINDTIFEGKVMEYEICVLIFTTNIV